MVMGSTSVEVQTKLGRVGYVTEEVIPRLYENAAPVLLI